MARIKDLTGITFGRLLVLHENGRCNAGRVKWKCLCNCGNIKTVSGNDLKSGHTSSCGCYQRERAYEANLIHGHRAKGEFPRIYRIWLGMKERCSNPNNIAYSHYGGKGIAVCEEWLTEYLIFYNWVMSNGYKEDLEIDRINNERGYSPQNCRWVTDKQQARNTSRCIFQTVYGDRMCLSEVAEKHNETKAAMLWRYHKQGKRGEALLREEKKSEILQNLSQV